MEMHTMKIVNRAGENGRCKLHPDDTYRIGILVLNQRITIAI